MYTANMFTISLNSENDHSASFSHLLSIFKIKFTDVCVKIRRLLLVSFT